ncbi:MAG: GTPase HflX [Deltaproteobacteria bacterium]|nr:GTPase HflX [Deltaproteobacteria bacterium]
MAPQSRPDRPSIDTMEELKLLAVTAGAEVAGSVVQKSVRINPAYYFGAGKVEEIAAVVQESGADLVICDEDLSPGQTRNLEKAIGTRVIDRSGIILDIFAKRAQSRAGVLQVELAQLTYLLPRLVGRGEMLSRLGGGIGTRGPGEMKLEVDRRRIRSRLTKIKHELKGIRSSREIHRKKRGAVPLPVVALVGYTNAGKSTLLNALTGADVFTEDKLFATLDPTTRKLRLPNGLLILVTDTVGFIQKLPHPLVEAFKATLEEINEAQLLLHVVDLHHPGFVKQMESVQGVLEEIGASDIPALYVYNKTDLCPDYRELFLQYPREIPSVLISALMKRGLDELKEEIFTLLLDHFEEVTVALPLHSPGGEEVYRRVMHEIHSQGKVLNQEFIEEQCIARVLVSRELAAKLKAKFGSAQVSSQ